MVDVLLSFPSDGAFKRWQTASPLGRLPPIVHVHSQHPVPLTGPDLGSHWLSRIRWHTESRHPRLLQRYAGRPRLWEETALSAVHVRTRMRLECSGRPGAYDRYLVRLNARSRPLLAIFGPDVDAGVLEALLATRQLGDAVVVTTVGRASSATEWLADAIRTFATTRDDQCDGRVDVARERATDKNRVHWANQWRRKRSASREQERR